MRFILLFYLLLVAARDDIILYGGGCAVVSNKLYYLGGSADTSKIDVNTKSYVLRLGSGFSLDSDKKAPWSEVGQSTDTQKSFGANVIAQGGNSNLIYIVGGRNIKGSDEFQTFDTGTNSWEADTKASTNLSKLNNLTYSYSFASIARNDVNTTEYVLYGGLTQTSNVKFVANNNLFRYISNNNVWSSDNSTGPSIYSHTATIYKGKMYLLGGFNVNNDSPQNFNKIPTYDLDSRIWSDTTTSGDIPSDRGGQATVQVKNNLYLIGGSSSATQPQPQSDGVYILNLDTFKWNVKKIDNLIGSYLGCLVQYNNQLIAAFGMTDPKLENTQLITLSKFDLVSTLEGAGPGANKDNPKNTNKTETDSPDPAQSSPAMTGIIVGSVIGGIAVLVIFGLTTFILVKIYLKKKHEAYLASIPIIEQHVWTYSPPNPVTDSSDMTLGNDTNMPEFDNNMGSSKHS